MKRKANNFKKKKEKEFEIHKYTRVQYRIQKKKRKKKKGKESTARNTRGNLFFVPTIVLESMTASASEKMKYCREGSSGRDTRKMSSNSSRNICIGGKIVSPLCSASLSRAYASRAYMSFIQKKRGEKKTESKDVAVPFFSHSFETIHRN